jgi:hypothetical protein
MKRSFPIHLVAPILALSLAGTAHAASQFVRQVVDRPDTLGQVTSLALDPQGEPRVAYWNPQRQDLRFATKNGGSWTLESPDSTDVVGLHTSLALASTGEPRVAYWNQTRGDLEYTSRAGGVWTVETVDSVGIVGQYASLKLDGLDQPHISYRDSTNGHLKYASKVGGVWNLETVDNGTDVGTFCSLALSSIGEPRIAYRDAANHSLKLATKTGLSWSIETVDAAGDVGEYASLALSADQPRIAYFDVGNGDLKYAYLLSGVWTSQAVDTAGIVGQYTSLVVDSGDRPHVSYYDATNGDLKYATNIAPGVWGTPTIDAAGVVGKFTSIALDDSLSRIAYYDATNGDLKVALQRFVVTLNQLTLSTWDTFQEVDTKGDVGQYASLVIQQGAPKIAYWDQSREDARYASWNGVSYDFEVASSGGNVGQFASLALDAGANPRISYYDGQLGDLKYAAKNGGTWQLETVDNAGIVGLYSSLKLDTNGVPHIAYRDSTNGDLKYAVKSGGTWTISVVDQAGDVGAYASLALTAQGDGRIAYWDATNRHLKLATQNGGAWTTETVDPAFDTGRYASLALTATGDPRISYYDAVNGDLLYAAFSSGSWTIQRVDSTGDVGKFTSLVLNSSDEPRISYYDATKKVLKFTNRGLADTSWAMDVVDSQRDGDVGLFSSLAEYVATFQGKPRVSYRMTYWDNTIGELRYAVQAYPDLYLWAYPGAYRANAGADSILNRARTLTLRWVRDPVLEGRPDFGGYRIYRVFNDPDTTRMQLIRRFSLNSTDSLFMWHFPPINEGTPVSQRIATYIDPDSSGTFFKQCRRDTSGKCYSPGDSVIVLLAPPGPHDGFRTWFAITIEQRNQASSDYGDLMLNDAITCRNVDRATCPNLNSKNRNMAGPVLGTSGPRADLLHVAVVPNPFRGSEAWDQTGANEVHFINLPAQAKISIYTVAGDLVVVLNHSDPVHDFERWDLKNGRGKDVASGIYMYRVTSTNFAAQDRFVVIR